MRKFIRNFAILRLHGNGTIRCWLGFIITMFSAGADNTAPLAAVIAVAAVGLLIMYDGVCALNRQLKRERIQDEINYYNLFKQ
mgnify:CR=1 FL=1